MQNVQKVIIIGAPRSGTNMLRDLLTELPRVGTWPCDEINYIWRHGNVRHTSDAFTREMATPEVKRYIQGHFDRFAKSNDLEILVEKTCANSLRVGFVDEVVPGAKYIFIVRDGLDVVGSSVLRWQAKINLPYLLKKARYVPMADLPYYGLRYFVSRLYLLFSNEKRLNTWGPVLENMREVISTNSLDELCAIQWMTCVNYAERDLASIPSENVHLINYESFVTNPVDEFARIASFIGRDVPPDFGDKLKLKVMVSSVGKGRRKIGESAVERITPLISETLQRHGY